MFLRWPALIAFNEPPDSGRLTAFGVEGDSEFLGGRTGSSVILGIDGISSLRTAELTSRLKIGLIALLLSLLLRSTPDHEVEEGVGGTC